MEADIPDKIDCIVDHMGRIAYISDAILQYKYIPDELIRTNIMELLDLSTIEPWHYFIMKCRKSYESRLITKDKIFIPVKILSLGSIEISNGNLEKLNVLQIIKNPQNSVRVNTDNDLTHYTTIKDAGDSSDNDILTSYYDNICI